MPRPAPARHVPARAAPLSLHAALIQDLPQVGNHLLLLADDLLTYRHLEFEFLQPQGLKQAGLGEGTAGVGEPPKQ